jgi:hypothetical protein
MNMQRRKTHFDQVPMEVAENALRVQPSQLKTNAIESLIFRNPDPIRIGIRRLLNRRPYRWSLKGSIDLHREGKLLKQRGKH